MKDIRIHVIPTANDDGSNASPETPDRIRQLFVDVNNLYRQADIRFVFDPQTDFEPIRRNTLLNLDTLRQPQNVVDSWPKKDDKALTDSLVKPLDDEKERIAREYPGKLVIFIGSGDRYYFHAESGKWMYGPCVNWVNASALFLRLVNGQPWDKFAHELTHYFYFGDNNTTNQGDVAGYLGPPDHITTAGIKTIGECLAPNGKQYHLTQPRVLYNAVVEPSPPGKVIQTRVICWSLTDFAARFDKEIALGQHLVHMQAYDGGGGQIRYDGVWEDGSKGQSRAICWAIKDFAKRFDDELQKGKHLVHMQAYDIGGGQIRYDGVWEDGSKGQSRAICWAIKDFAKRFDDELQKGKHLVHMQAYDISGGQIRYDGVWEEVSKGQSYVIGWEFQDFVSRFDAELAKSRRLVHIQQYKVGDGQIIYDGVWEDCAITQKRILALGIGDFAVRLDNQLARSQKILHMQACIH